MNRLLNLKFFSIVLLLLVGVLGFKSSVLLFKHHPTLFTDLKALLSSNQPENTPTKGAMSTTHQDPLKQDDHQPPHVTIEGQVLTEGRGLSEQLLINDLKAQVQQQRDQQILLDLRQQTIEALEAKITKKLEELQKMKETINQSLQEQHKVKDDKVKSLVNMYENMPPKKAAEVLEALDMDIVLIILEKMKAFKAAPILANMSPSKVGEISRKYTKTD